MSELEERIDEVLVKILESIESYNEHRRILNFVFKNGIFDLSMAKRTMGVHNISRVQYDGRMKASTQIVVQEKQPEDSAQPSLEGSPIEMQLSIQIPTPGFSAREQWELDAKSASPEKETVKEKTNVTSSKNSNNNNNNGEPEKEGNRKRVSNLRDEQKNGVAKETEMEEMEPDYNGNQFDPLKWFGVLVSPHLKTSQAHFKKALPEIVTLSNISLEMHHLLAIYDKLILEKNKKLQKNSE